MESEQEVLKQVDFAKYRTDELFQTIADLMSLPGKFRLTIFCSLAGSIGLFLFVRWFYQHYQTPSWISYSLQFYAFPSGAFSGLAFGIAESIRRSLSGMLRILDLLLDTTSRVAADIRQLRSGDQKMPSAGELVEVVYQHVFYPTVRAVIGGSLGFLGKPVLWFYGSTLGRLERLVIKDYIPDSNASNRTEPQQQFQDVVGTAADALVAQETAIVQQIAWAREQVAGIGGWIKLLLMMPCYIVFVLITTLVALPIVAIAVLIAMDWIGSADVAAIIGGYGTTG